MSATSRHFLLTTQPVRITAVGSQDLRLAFDAIPFDETDLMLRVLSQEGGSPSIDVVVQTGLDRDGPTSWVDASAFARVSTTTGAERIHVNPARYLRWSVTDLGSTAATFVIEGVGRTWARRPRADEIAITEQPVRAQTSLAPAKQDLRLCFDTSAYDVIDLVLMVSEGSSVDIRMKTNMQNESENGWLDLAAFTTTSAPGVTTQRLQNFLKYLRWELTSVGIATFTIRGVGRRWV